MSRFIAQWFLILITISAMWAGPAQAITPDDEAAKAKDNITTIGNVKIGGTSIPLQLGLDTPT